MKLRSCSGALGAMTRDVERNQDTEGVNAEVIDDVISDLEDIRDGRL